MLSTIPCDTLFDNSYKSNFKNKIFKISKCLLEINYDVFIDTKLFKIC